MNLPEELVNKIAEQDRKQSITNSVYSHNIVSLTGYLLGVDKAYFLNEIENPNRALFVEIFDELEKNKRAKILRNLCIVRTNLEKNFKKINIGMHKNTFRLESFPKYVPKEALDYLHSQKIRIPVCKKTVDYVIEFNRLIQERVNDCYNLYDMWVEWKYIKSLFIMPDGLKVEGTKIAAERYYANMDRFPYKVYANIKYLDEGNILYNDDKLLSTIYRWHGDEFTDKGHITVLNEDTKEAVYKFLKESERIAIVVDCENSDPFRLHAVLDYLSDSLSAVEKILLFNDPKTTVAWNNIGQDLNIPVKQIITERVLEHKSLVDGRLIAETAKEHYKNDIDSFVLVSSDSDYSALIKTFGNDAHFLVMMEREQRSPLLLDRLKELKTPYCYIEDFPCDESDSMKAQIILQELKRTLMENFNYNIDKLLIDTAKKTRAELSPAELKGLKKLIANNIRIEIDENGTMKIELNKQK